MKTLLKGLRCLVTAIIRSEVLPRVHACYDPIEKAIGGKKLGWRFRKIQAKRYFFLNRSVVDLRILAILHVAEHLQFSWDLLCEDDNESLYFVREFLTIPMLVASPIWGSLSGRIFFQNNHNVQSACTNRINRAALYFLRLLGANFVSHELDVFSRFTLLKFSPPLLIIPFPAAERGALTRRTRALNERLKVGVVGSLRAEQRGEITIELLLKAREKLGLLFDIVLASNSMDRLESLRSHSVTLSFLRDEREYWECLESLDIVVVNYDPEKYFWRTSGIVADAASSGAVVLAPDFPVLRLQVQEPVKVGFVFSDFETFCYAILAAFDSVRNHNPSVRARAYYGMRSVGELSRSLEQMRDYLSVNLEYAV